MQPCCVKFIVFMMMVQLNGPQLLTPYRGQALVRILSADKEISLVRMRQVRMRKMTCCCYYPSSKHSRSAPGHELLEMLDVFRLYVCVCVCSSIIPIQSAVPRTVPDTLIPPRGSSRGLVCRLCRTRCGFLSPSQQQCCLMATIFVLLHESRR